jgi:hemerythrin
VPLIPWNNKFTIEIDVIDDQHKNLFTIINSVYDMVRAGDGEAAVLDAVDKLIDYTKYHFEREEQLMKDIDYPRYEIHKVEHDNLTDKVIEFRESISAGEKVDPNSFISFLFEWLTKHIMDRDKKIGAYIQLKKMEPSDVSIDGKYS